MTRPWAPEQVTDDGIGHAPYQDAGQVEVSSRHLLTEADMHDPSRGQIDTGNVGAAPDRHLLKLPEPDTGEWDDAQAVGTTALTEAIEPVETDDPTPLVEDAGKRGATPKDVATEGADEATDDLPTAAAGGSGRPPTLKPPRTGFREPGPDDEEPAEAGTATTARERGTHSVGFVRHEVLRLLTKAEAAGVDLEPVLTETQQRAVAQFQDDRADTTESSMETGMWDVGERIAATVTAKLPNEALFDYELPTDRTVGQIVGDIRASKGVTREQVATAVGVSPAGLSRLHSGDSHSAKLMERVLVALDVPLEQSQELLNRLAAERAREHGEPAPPLPRPAGIEISEIMNRQGITAGEMVQDAGIGERNLERLRAGGTFMERATVERVVARLNLPEREAAGLVRRFAWQKAEAARQAAPPGEGERPASITGLIGHTLRARGLAVQDVAHDIGVTRGTIDHMVGGRANIGRVTAQKVLARIGLPIRESNEILRRHEQEVLGPRPIPRVRFGTTGTSLRELRDLANQGREPANRITSESLARTANVPKATIMKLLQADAYPDPSVLRVVCQELGVPANLVHRWIKRYEAEREGWRRNGVYNRARARYYGEPAE
jgi:transcriptional regulator with XRE-family HTH domain